MGRKSKKGGGTPTRQHQQKLKQQQQQQQEATPGSAFDARNSNSNHSKNDTTTTTHHCEDDVEPFLSARLVVAPRQEGASGSANRGSTGGIVSHPRVLLSTPDADRLDVASRENILLLSLFVVNEKEDSSSPTNSDSDPAGWNGNGVHAALLPAEIMHNQHRPSRVVIAPGTIQITTAFLTDRLLSCGPAGTTNRKTGEDPDQATPSRDQSSSSNKHNFSFKIGGGGDLLYASTPSPRAKTFVSPSKSSLTSSQKKRPVVSTQKVILIPARSILGKQLVNVLCADCHRLVLEPAAMNMDQHNDKENGCDTATTTTTTATKDRLLLLQRLVVAHTVRRQVQPQEIIKISVAGRATEYRIVQCQAKKKTTNATTTITTTAAATSSSSKSDGEDTTLSETMKQLSLNEGGGDQDANSNLQKRLNDIITNAQLLTEPLLYQITYETIIEFVAPADPTLIQQQPTNTSPPPPPFVPQQPQPLPLTQRVVGLDATLAECRALLTTPLLHPELFVTTKPPRGILLHGPSGVGKTCLARQLADEFLSLRIHEEKDSNNVVAVHYVHCASLLSQTAVVGQAERQLTRLFHSSSSSTTDNPPRARLIILDDLHLIGAKRGSHHAGADRLAATLLALLDGITTTGPSSSSSVLMVLGITRNPSLLDAALRRPGRLDVEVPVPLPDDAATRAQILQFHYGNLMACTSGDADSDGAITESDWLELGTLAKGFNGADCVLAIKEAIRMSLPAQHVMNDSVASANPAEQRPIISVSMNHLRAAIRATKPSAIKSITVEIPRVLWSAIGGMDAVKTELREAIELPVTHHDFFEQLRVPPPRGILLYGPPGCSKTLMARALATEGHMNFLAVKGPELLSKWLGESERALASLFRRARMASPCIIFFDEIDAIASKRGGSSDSASSGRLLSQLLTELDGIHHPMGIVSSRNSTSRNSSGEGKDHRVVVVGATNRPDLLDPALTRPGRIDCKIYVGVPDEASRSHILELSLHDRSCDADIDVPRLARDSQGCSGAEMVAICRDAALLALEESDCLSTASVAQATIAMRHLVQALQDTQRQITPEMIDFYASYRDNSRGSDR